MVNRRQFVVDAVIAVVVALLAVFAVEGADSDFALRSLDDVPLATFPLVAVATAALFWRRRWPLQVLAVTTLATTAASLLEVSEVIGVTMLMALYGVGRRVADQRQSSIALLVVLALTLPTVLVDDAAGTAELFFGFLVLGGTWYVGRRMRSRWERREHAERERHAEARRMVVEERTRIARELHDIVAHRVTVMTVQAGAAKTVAADDPAAALRAMEAVEHAGRQALDELRHLLHVLRPEAEADGLGPQPGLDDLPRLLDQYAEAGLDVRLASEDVPPEVPAAVGLSAYRIVEEALTNVLKHAGPGTRVHVRIDTRDGEVMVEVVDDGKGATSLPGTGHGILGMRERAQLLGGRLDAAPRAGGGFHVVAHLPLDQVSA